MTAPYARTVALSSLGTGSAGYTNEGGAIVEPDHYIAAMPIAIETMPMCHYFPGDVPPGSGIGCTFSCGGCISGPSPPCRLFRGPPHILPDALRRAKKEGCRGYVRLNDPTAMHQTFLRCLGGARCGLSSGARRTATTRKSRFQEIDLRSIL